MSETKTINLVDGTFTPSEAHDVIQALIDQKINFHKFAINSRIWVWISLTNQF